MFERSEPWTNGRGTPLRFGTGRNPLGYRPPAEYEEQFCRALAGQPAEGILT